MSDPENPHHPTGVRRWGAYLLLVVVFAFACGLLSWWQWDRRAETLAEGTLVTRNYESAPVALDTLLPRLGSWKAGDEWRPVELKGRYLTDEKLLVRNRVFNANPGFEVLVPFQLDDGRVFVVDRGWLPIGSKQDTPDHVPAPPTGEVTVVVRLQQSEPVLPGRSAPHGQIPEINAATVASMAGTAGSTYTGAYGLLARETPAPADRPAAVQEPVIDEGPHLSYAIQWIAFAVLAFFGLVWAYRREKRINALPAEQRAAARAPKARSSDTDAEDAILDRAGIH
ncbi:MAG TPA: SURF1 family cytochrome oxidase biogenesis protein [Pseudolysinimonas sp.]|nr:SURF1 family cytochrome oxidase biogenesis protein [Pseudolysinimonas sp.]